MTWLGHGFFIAFSRIPVPMRVRNALDLIHVPIATRASIQEDLEWNAISKVSESQDQPFIHPLLPVIRRRDIHRALKRLKRIGVSIPPKIMSSHGDISCVEELNRLVDQVNAVIDSTDALDRVKVRICINFSKYLNKCIREWPFRFHTILHAFSLIRKGYFTASIDLKNYFKQILIDHRFWKYMGFSFEGNTYACTRCPFGIKIGPALASLVTAVISQILQFENITAVFMIDDILIIAPTYELCLLHRNRALVLLHELGLVVNDKKTTEPSQSNTFLGIIINTIDSSLRLPPEKIEEYRWEAQPWWDQLENSITAGQSKRIRTVARELQSFLGRCERIALVYPAAKAYTRALWQSFVYYHGEIVSNATIEFSPEAILEFEWWYQLLAQGALSANGWVYSWAESPTTLVSWSDASGTGQFAVIIGGMVLQGRVKNEHMIAFGKPVSSTFLELVPIWLLLTLLGPRIRGCLYIAYTDNLNNARTLNRIRCQSTHTFYLLREIILMSHEFQLTVVGAWLPREELHLLDYLSKEAY
jgi:hypothetical protein